MSINAVSIDVGCIQACNAQNTHGTANSTTALRLISIGFVINIYYMYVNIKMQEASAVKKTAAVSLSANRNRSLCVAPVRGKCEHKLTGTQLRLPAA